VKHPLPLLLQLTLIHGFHYTAATMKCNSGVASRGTMFKSREIEDIRKERHKYDDIRLCFSITCSKKSWALKYKQEVGRQLSSLTLAVDRSEWTAVYPNKQHLCTHNRMLGHPQS